VQIEKQFEVERPRDETVEIACCEETLLGLFPGAQTEIVKRDGDRVTARTRYRALGREGVATFDFTFLLDGGLHFEKQCDGRVWRELSGNVSFEECGAKTRVRIEMRGRTKPFVPELAIKGPMQEQIDQMAAALRDRVEGR
jgi:carbon monoxide dehydrogenase subunit G